jgi:hypothetical protein
VSVSVAGPDFAFGIMQFLVPIIFIIVIGGIIFTIFRGIGQWSYNNRQPRLTVAARVVSKRMNVSHHHHNHNDHLQSHSSTTTYYVTFEVESGDRLEFAISGSEYGQLVEGDQGKLSFQGTRYQGFAREKIAPMP